ncbi:hypothetical protein [Sphaerisporangium sp. NPDC051011]|uniref:hypothetical protein n=1 Tax=Sphaerisporangium sp. NPDC051011 TaxID=3155792 RepID=UPI003401C95C
MRYTLLAWLAWGLHRADRTAILVVRRQSEPVLYLERGDGHKVAVLAIERGDQWFFIWGPEMGVPAERQSTTVETIAQAVA